MKREIHVIRKVLAILILNVPIAFGLYYLCRNIIISKQIASTNVLLLIVGTAMALHAVLIYGLLRYFSLSSGLYAFVCLLGATVVWALIIFYH
jgi:hypothetical protein